MKRVLLLTNYLTPYRRVCFDHLRKAFRDRKIAFRIWIMSGKDPDYDWYYDELKTDGMRLLKEHTLLLRSESYKIILNPELPGLLKKAKPDLVIMAGDYLALSVWAALLGKYLLGYKVLFWSESHLDESSKRGRFLIAVRETIRKIFYRCPDGFLYPGEKAAAFVRKYCRENAQLLQYPNLIDNASYRSAKAQTTEADIQAYRKEHDIPDGSFVFSCVARLDWEKGIYEFLQLLTRCKHRDRVVLLIAGRGEAQQRLEEYARKNRLHVQFLGYCTQAEITQMHCAADAFVLPSLADPNPLSVIEALWCELPLLLTKHVGNHPEVVREGENGYVIDYQEEDAAVQKIEKMITADDAWLKQARKITKRIAEEHFDADRASRMLVEKIADAM